MRRFKSLLRFASGTWLSLEVKVVDMFVPDRFLLFVMNILDRRVSPKAIDKVFDVIVKRVPSKVLTSLIDVADQYVPDTAASSRKVSTVIAGVGKYVPDKVIPKNSLDSWSNLKVKFHIPTLLSRGNNSSKT